MSEETDRLVSWVQLERKLTDYLQNWTTISKANTDSVKMIRVPSHTSLFGLYNWQSHSNLSSGILTRASLGSMVQKGKFSAGIANLVRVLKRVDFPTFGKPTWTKNNNYSIKKMHKVLSYKVLISLTRSSI